MEPVAPRARIVPPVDPAVLAAAAREARRAMDRENEPSPAIDAAIGALNDAVPTLLPSLFVLEHGRLWLVAQRGYAVVPDGIDVGRGVMGRAVRLGRDQLVLDVRTDPDYFGPLPGIGSELAVPLRFGRVPIGVLNLESERALPSGAAGLVRPLSSALARSVGALRAGPTLDLAALARLSVHFGSLRDPDEIAALAAASLTRVITVETSQVWAWDDPGSPVELASWQATSSARAPLTAEELEITRLFVDPAAVCQLVDTRAHAQPGRFLVWLPLRANGEELGVLVGTSHSPESADPGLLDTAAVLAAQVAASLDVALVLRRERQSAVTDQLTGILNRRGLEAHLDNELLDAQEHRAPLSILVFDCDDFKEINDRAGHGFGDALLREVADELMRSLPEGAEAARLGGDEFVVVLPSAGTEVAEALGTRIRSVLAAGLTDAGFPLRISAGISTYPFDGARPSTLLRAADQALYIAKDRGKDRVATFRDVVRAGSLGRSDADTASADERRRGAGSRSGGSVLAEAAAAAKAIGQEETSDAVLDRLCKALVFVVGATACSASRVAGEYLVDVAVHALREVPLSDEAAYRIRDFPLTAEALLKGEPRTVSFLDGEVDPAEAFVLRQLSMNALLMLPLRVHGKSWGLIELYEMRLRRFSADDVAVAEFLTAQAERRLEVVALSESERPRPPVYELPGGIGGRGAPRTR
jgi:diguanylate cyclase (GGDEF)-like protein